MSHGGWHPAYRKMYDPGHWLAPTERDPSNRRDAWSDLFMMATRQPRQGPGYELGRGEIITSVRTLAKRWFWSKTKVGRFLDELEERDSLKTVCGTPSGTIYRIVKYDTYAIGSGDKWDTQRAPARSGTPKRDRKRDTFSPTAVRENPESLGHLLGHPSGTRTIRDSSSLRSSESISSDFEELWLVCKRGPKKKALDQYRRAVPKKATHDSVLEGWKAHVAAASAPEFVAHLFRWIRDERWTEEIPSKNGNDPDWSLKL